MAEQCSQWPLDADVATFDYVQKALLPGDSEVQQLLHTFQLLGTPNEQSWPGVSQLKVRETRGVRYRLGASPDGQAPDYQLAPPLIIAVQV